MKQYVIRFSDSHSYRDERAVYSTPESDGWWENVYETFFEAETNQEAFLKATSLCEADDGVFNVYELAFTEEGLDVAD